MVNDEWLTIVFTRTTRMMRMSAGGRCGGCGLLWIFLTTDLHRFTQIRSRWLGLLMIVDYWLSSHGQHGWCGCPQADFVGKRQLSSIGQQLKEKYFFNCRYIAGNCCSRKRVGGLWSAIAINDQQLKEYIYWWTQTEVRKRTRRVT